MTESQQIMHKKLERKKRPLFDIEETSVETGYSLPNPLIVGVDNNHLPNAEEINPLAAIAGSYADDPNWNEFIRTIEELRRESDKIAGLAK